MTTLFVFGDESGTMPLHDKAPPFAAATVSFFGSEPACAPSDPDVRQLASTIAGLGGIAFSGYVKPRPGYAEALEGRQSKLDTMARSARLSHGRNRDFIPRDGISRRNEIWSLCMQEVVGFAYALAVHRGPVDALEVFLDRKTLAAEDRNRFRFVLSGQADRFGDVLRRLPPVHQERARILQDRNRARPDTTSVRWSDEAGAESSAAGLRLAHHLARFARAMVMDPGTVDLPSVCTDEGCHFDQIDLTDIAIRPVDRENVHIWENATGLREPEA